MLALQKYVLPLRHREMDVAEAAQLAAERLLAGAPAVTLLANVFVVAVLLLWFRLRHKPTACSTTAVQVGMARSSRVWMIPRNTSSSASGPMTTMESAVRRPVDAIGAMSAL